MIGQIAPLVQAATKRVWIQAVAGHIAGTTLSAAALGLVLGTCGLAIGLDRWGAPLRLVSGALFIVCALQDGGGWRWVRPSLHRQTPAWFRPAFGPLWGELAWGVDLGQGWTTRILFSGYYGLVLWAILRARPAHAVVVLGAYGLGRGLPVLTASFRARHVRLAILATAYMARLPVLYQVNAVALAFTAGYLLVE
jgi:cytochrome c biogenesis protein CcdA